MKGTSKQLSYGCRLCDGVVEIDRKYYGKKFKLSDDVELMDENFFFSDERVVEYYDDEE